MQNYTEKAQILNAHRESLALTPFHEALLDHFNSPSMSDDEFHDEYWSALNSSGFSLFTTASGIDHVWQCRYNDLLKLGAI